MTSFDNALKSDEGNSVYPPDLAKAIFELDIPDRIYLKTAMEFDDKYIVNKGNKWTFDYSGSRRYLVFNQDYISNKLNKYICFKYASTRFPTKLPALHLDWRNIISYCREHGGFSLSTLRLFIEKEDIDNATFYSVLFGLKILCAETFPGFNLEDYDDLEFVPRPYLEHWGVYQEIDNILDPLEKNMICNGLFEMASLLRDGKSFSHSEVRNAAILGLAYVTGARPVQLARLAVKDVRIDTRNQESGLIRYSVFLPYAKQRRVTTERLFLAILNFCPPEYQAAVACGEAALPTITPTDLRHNVGHSLAMQGASAEEIAHVLGHTSLAVAKYYIMATPALALIRAKALGSNPVWQNMVAMMLTGELVDSAHWKGHPVVGLVGDELHDKIGGCSRNSSTCPFSEVRSCYGCLYYRPFTDGEHQALLECVKKEVDELIAISDGVGNSRNPLILIHETTQFEIESVIARCRFHQEQVKSNEKSL
ncbi:site-specific integrase [Escherichia coli]